MAKAVDVIGDVVGGIGDLLGDVVGSVFESVFGDMFAVDSPEMGDSFGLKIQENAPRRTLYGEDVIGGNIVGYGKTEINKKSYHVLHCLLVNHRCESVELESINGQSASRFASIVEQEIQLGDQVSASRLALRYCYNWSSKHIGYDQTMVTIKIEINEDKLPNGLSDIRWKVKGKKVYDPRKDTSIGGYGPHRADSPETWEYSNNAILCSFDHLRFAGYKTIPLARFDLVELMSEANICDEPVHFIEDGQDKTEPRYTCNGMFQHTSGHGTVLSGMLNSCNGRVRRGGGKIRLKCGSYHGPASVTLTLDDASGPIKYNPWPTISKRLNSVRTSIIDPNKNYVKTALEPVVDEQHRAKTGLILDAEIKVPFARTVSLGKRLCNQAMAQANAGTIVFPTKNKGFLLFVGSTVQVTIPERGIDQEFLVLKAEPKFNPEGDWEMNLLLREESLAMYPDDFIPVTDAATPNTSLPDNTLPPQPRNLSIDLDINSNLSNGSLTWEVSSEQYDRFEITVFRDNKVILIDNSETTRYVLRNELPAGDYRISVKAVNRFGRYSDPSNIHFEIVLPAKPLVDVSVNNFQLVISPHPAGAFLNTTYQAFIHTENDFSGAKNLGLASQFTVLVQPGTSYHIWVKAINLSGESGFTYRKVQSLENGEIIAELLKDKIDLTQLSKAVRDNLSSLLDGSSEQKKLIEEVRRKLDQNDIDKLESLAGAALIDIERAEASAIAKQGMATAKEAKAAVVEEGKARAIFDKELQAKVEQSSAEFTEQVTAIADQVSSEVFKITTLQSMVDNINARYISSAQVRVELEEVEARIDRELQAEFDQNTGRYGQQIKVAVDSAKAAVQKADSVSSKILDEDGNVSESFVQSLDLSSVTVDGETLAGAIKNFTVAAGGQTHSIEQIALASISADGSTFSSQFGVKTSLNDIEYGYGLYNTGSKTYFALSVNSVVFFDPSTHNIATAPFIFENGHLYLSEASIKDLSVEKLRGDVVHTDSLPLLPHGFSRTSIAEKMLISFFIEPEKYEREAIITSIPIRWGDDGGALMIRIFVNNTLVESRLIKSHWHPSPYKFSVSANQRTNVRITAQAFGGSALINEATPIIQLVKKGSSTITVVR